MTEEKDESVEVVEDDDFEEPEPEGPERDTEPADE
jgi:hypothetical protein